MHIYTDGFLRSFISSVVILWLIETGDKPTQGMNDVNKN